MSFTRILGLLAIGCFLAVMAPRRGVWGDYGLSDRKIDPERLCRAIYLAEGGDKAHKPYGILKGLIEGEPGHASYYCEEIVKKRLSLWDGKGCFISYLQKSWAPLGASNDPSNLNANWAKNVQYFYENACK